MSFNEVGDEIATTIDHSIVGWTDQTIGELARGIAHSVGLGDHVVRTIHTIRTGYLSANVVFDYNPDGKPVALWLETGFKAHKIRAGMRTRMTIIDIESEEVRIGTERYQGMLRWLDTRTGKFRFAREVNHPGFVGYGIMERAYELGTPLLEDMITQALETDQTEF